MTKTIELRYLEDQAQYQANFFKGAKLFASKALTNDEAEIISMVYGLPSSSELVILQADFIADALMEYAELDESNLMLILEELTK